MTHLGFIEEMLKWAIFTVCCCAMPCTCTSFTIFFFSELFPGVLEHLRLHHSGGEHHRRDPAGQDRLPQTLQSGSFDQALEEKCQCSNSPLHFCPVFQGQSRQLFVPAWHNRCQALPYVCLLMGIMIIINIIPIIIRPCPMSASWLALSSSSTSSSSSPSSSSSSGPALCLPLDGHPLLHLRHHRDAGE